MEKEYVLGFKVCNADYDQMTKEIFSDFSNEISNFIVNVNPEIIIKNYKNTELIQVLNSEKYQIPDGIGIVYASKINKGNIKQRITGIDLMNEICIKSTKYNSKIFLYGSKPGIASKAKEELEKKIDGINIVGTCNGYEKEEVVLEKINKSGANMLFVGLGSPKQEQFIIKNRNKLESIKIFMPVGGSFDVISNSIKRAPEWVIKFNIEWLYRLIKQPKRIFRQLRLLKFMFLVFIHKKDNKKRLEET